MNLSCRPATWIRSPPPCNPEIYLSKNENPLCQARPEDPLLPAACTSRFRLSRLALRNTRRKSANATLILSGETSASSPCCNCRSSRCPISWALFSPYSSSPVPSSHIPHLLIPSSHLIPITPKKSFPPTPTTTPLAENDYLPPFIINYPATPTDGQ